MKKIALPVCILLFVASGSQAVAQMDEKAQKAWMDYMTPGDVHKMLAKSNGAWKGEVTMWMAPGQPPSTMTATCTNTMLLGGRYLQSTNKGEMMGMPFEGIGVLGYDNATKMFTYTWIDNMGTGTMTLKGSWDNSTKSINLSGSMFDPMSGKETTVREVYTITDDNNQLVQMYSPGPDGKEYKNMEIKLTRM